MRADFTFREQLALMQLNRTTDPGVARRIERYAGATEEGLRQRYEEIQRRNAGTLIQAHRQGQQVRQRTERMIDTLAAQIEDREADRRWSRRVWVVVGVLMAAIVVAQVVVR